MAPVYVVMPCHREPLDAVVASLDSALAILGANVVIVDDGVARDDLDALRSPRVTVLHRTENGGPSAALDDGFRSTPHGSVLCRLDVRDSYYPDAKARQIETVQRGTPASCSPHFDPVAGRVHVPPRNWRTRIYTDSCFTSISMAIRRDVWERVGIDTTLRWAEDWRFLMLIEHTIGFEMFDEVTCAAGEFAGGHSDVTASREKRELRDSHVARVYEIAQALAHPDKYAHLYSEQWCAKRGRKPLPRRAR